MTQQIHLPEDVRTALFKVLDYMWEEEVSDDGSYDEPDHIGVAVERVADATGFRDLIKRRAANYEKNLRTGMSPLDAYNQAQDTGDGTDATGTADNADGQHNRAQVLGKVISQLEKIEALIYDFDWDEITSLDDEETYQLISERHTNLQGTARAFRAWLFYKIREEAA